jgi:antitoxin ParD1/3/4
MSASADRTFRLSAEQADYIEAQVRSGAYASASEVLDAGIRALQDRDAGLESWLRQEVAATYDAMQANPSRAVPLDSVFDEIRAHHEAKTSRRP